MIYGEGVRSLAHELGVTADAARSIRADVDQAYPAAARWAAEQRRAAQAGEMLVSQFGRRLIDSRVKPYRAVNHMVQSAAADVFKPGMLRTASLLPRDSLWLPVHDELVVQVPVGQEQEAARALREGMSAELGGVTISGQPEIIGSAWAKAGSPAA